MIRRLARVYPHSSLSAGGGISCHLVPYSAMRSMSTTGPDEITPTVPSSSPSEVIDVKKAVKELMDDQARNPLSPVRQLPPSYTLAAQPFILTTKGASQCTTNGFVARQLYAAAQRYGFYSPLWLSESAAIKHDLQLRIGQCGVAVSTPFSGSRFIPLASLKDQQLIAFIGQKRLVTQGSQLNASPDVKGFAVTRTAVHFLYSASYEGEARAANLSTIPPYLHPAFDAAHDRFQKQVHLKRDTEQFLNTQRAHQWAKLIWVSVAEAIEFHLQHIQSSKPLPYGEVLDASVFLRNHVTDSGRAASFRVPMSISQLFNSEQFTDNATIINLTQQTITDYLQEGHGAATNKGSLPNTVRWVPIDKNISSHNIIGRLLADTSAVALHKDYFKLDMSDEDIASALGSEDDECIAKEVAAMADLAGRKALEADLDQLKVDLKASSRRYAERFPMSPRPLTKGNDCTADCKALDLASCKVLTADDELDGSSDLPQPVTADSAEALDIESCQALTADDALFGPLETSDLAITDEVCEADYTATKYSALHFMGGAHIEATEATPPSVFTVDDERIVHGEDGSGSPNLPQPVAADSAEALDIESCHALTADDAYTAAIEVQKPLPLSLPDITIMAADMVARAAKSQSLKKLAKMGSAPKPAGTKATRPPDGTTTTTNTHKQASTQPIRINNTKRTEHKML